VLIARVASLGSLRSDDWFGATVVSIICKYITTNDWSQALAEWVPQRAGMRVIPEEERKQRQRQRHKKQPAGDSASDADSTDTWTTDSTTEATQEATQEPAAGTAASSANTTQQ
jgi:hypothetical protein